MDAQIEIANLQDRITALEGIVYRLIQPGRFSMDKTVAISDSVDVTTGITTGTKLPALSTQKLGFWGATPIVRPSAISAPAGGATVDSQSRTAITSIISTLQSLGLTA